MKKLFIKILLLFNFFSLSCLDKEIDFLGHKALALSIDPIFILRNDTAKDLNLYVEFFDLAPKYDCETINLKSGMSTRPNIKPLIKMMGFRSIFIENVSENNNFQLYVDASSLKSNFMILSIKQKSNKEYFIDIIDVRPFWNEALEINNFLKLYCDKLNIDTTSSFEGLPKALRNIVYQYTGLSCVSLENKIELGNFLKYLEHVEIETRQSLRNKISSLIKRIKDAPRFDQTEKAKAIKSQLLTLWTQAMSPELFNVDQIKKKIDNFEKLLNSFTQLIKE